MSDTYYDDPATNQPMPEGAKPEAWKPPTSDQEWAFTGDITSAPEWVDKGWASYDGGPALAVPAGDVYGKGPYVTKTARPGDTIKFIAAKKGQLARFEIIQGDAVEQVGELKIPAQQSGVHLEDALKGGTMSVSDVDDATKAQLLSRSPEMQQVFDNPPEPAQ